MTENEQQPFSEEAALRELEELQQKIEASRVRRKEANEAFDRFLHTFERPPAPAPIKEKAAPAPLPPGPDHEVQYLLPPPPASIPKDSPPVPSTPPAAPIESPSQSSGVMVQPFAEPAATAPVRIETPPPALPSELPSDAPEALDLDGWDRTSAAAVDTFPEESPPVRDPFRAESRSVPVALSMPGRRGTRIPLAAGVGAAALVIAVAAFFALRGNGDEAAPAVQVTAESPAAAPHPTAPPAPAPVDLPPQRAEISTLRQVWIRVMVDGQKVIERELPPNTHIPLNPVSQFVVRAGDAGAVRVAIEGKDQGPVGADGQVATKAFSVPPKAGQ